MGQSHFRGLWAGGGGAFTSAEMSLKMLEPRKRAMAVLAGQRLAMSSRRSLLARFIWRRLICFHRLWRYQVLWSTYSKWQERWMKQEGSVGESKALSGEGEKLWGEGTALFLSFLHHNSHYSYLLELSIVLLL